MRSSRNYKKLHRFHKKINLESPATQHEEPPLPLFQEKTSKYDSREVLQLASRAPTKATNSSLALKLLICQFTNFHILCPVYINVIVRPFWPSRCPLTFSLLGIVSGIIPLSQAQLSNRKPQTPNILPSSFLAVSTSCRPTYNLSINPLEFHAFLCNLFTSPEYLTTGLNMQYPFCNWYFYDLSSNSTGFKHGQTFFL